MTTWVESPRGGRERGLRALARAWLEVLVRPRRFFRAGVAPGDQAPGLVFAVAVGLAYLASLLLSGAARVPPDLPVVGGAGPLATVVVVLVVALLVAPAVLHLTAAVQTLFLMALVEDRAGVSETVQVIAYATAPCAVAGVPVPSLRLVCALWGSALLVVGTSEVHDTGLVRAAATAALPAALLFGYAFGGVDAAVDVGHALATLAESVVDSLG